MSLTTDGGLSPADLAAITGNNNNGGCGWGGDGAWIILLFIIWAAFGGDGFGFGGNNGRNGANSAAAQGALTREQACIDNNFQNLMRETAGISDAVNLGFSNLNSTICNQQYDTARMINGLESTVQGGFNSTNIALLQGQNALQSQIAGCCCDAQQAIQGVNFNIAQQTNALGTAIQGVNYNLATQSCDTRNTLQSNTRDLIDNQNANTRAILDKLTQQELAAKDAQITALNNQLFRADLAASQTAQNQYLVNQLRPCPVPAYITCNPYTASYGVGLANSGCGCGGYAA